jgi:hypothetical protein
MDAKDHRQTFIIVYKRIRFLYKRLQFIYLLLEEW